jgi:hypothetical protein
MKAFFVAILLSCCSVVFAQNIIVVKEKSITGGEYNRIMPKVTDPKVYDRAGNVLDSVKVRQMVKTFDYGVGQAIPKGQTEYKHVLMKLDHVREAEIDARTKLQFRPKSPKFWEGVTLDLSPLAKRIDLSKLEGKAVVLIFWSNQYPGSMFAPTNDVIADYIGGGKFDVYAITQLPYDVAKEYLTKTPINAHQILNAQSIVDFYDTQNDVVVVVTNAKHQVTFAITGQAAMTPRTLNKLLKEL